MDNSNLIRIQAIFLITLIVLLPVELSASVGAVWGGTQFRNPSGESGNPYVVIRTILGEDQIPDYRRSLDRVTIIAQASLGSNTTLGPDNLEAYFSGFGLGMFDSCTQVSGQNSIYECMFTEPEGGGPASTAAQTYTVNLVNQTEVIDTISKDIVVDSTAPSILKFDLHPTITRDNTTTLSFDIIDYSYGNNQGVGIESASVTVNGAEQYNYPGEVGIDSTQPDGFYDPDIVVKRLKKTIDLGLGDTTGDYSICIYANDYFDYSVSECKTVRVDRTSPEILGQTFEVLERDGRELFPWFTGDSRELLINLNFRSEDLDLDTIYGNLSDVNLNGGFDQVRGSCTPLLNSTYKCKFYVTAKINETRSYRFHFSAEDDLGNRAEATFRQSLKFDNTGPSATAIGLSVQHGSMYFIGKEHGILSIDFTEDGYGLNNSDIYLDLSDFGVGSNVKADNCTPSWTCYWNDFYANVDAADQLDDLEHSYQEDDQTIYYSVNAKIGQIKITAPSLDDLNNPAEYSKFNVSIDVYAPVLEDLIIEPIPYTSDFPGYTVANDSLYIKVNVSDAMPVTMFIETDDFFGEKFNDTIPCNYLERDIYSCEYILGPITKDGYYEGIIDFDFTDILGNSLAVKSDPIEVIEVDEASTSYWTANDRGCSPNPLDRELVDKIPTQIFCQIELTSNSNAKIYHMTPGTCRELSPSDPLNPNSTIRSLSSYDWLGLQRQEPFVYLNFLTRPFNPRVNRLYYECDLNVRSIVDDKKITRNYEQLTVRYNVALYHSPLGEVSDHVWQKADDIHDKYVKNLWAIVGYLEGFLDLASRLCVAAHTVTNVLNAINQFSLIWGLATSETQAVQAGTGGVSAPVTGPLISSSALADNALDAKHAGMIGGFKKTWNDIVGPFCGFISCKYTFGGETWTSWINKVDSMTYYITGQFMIDRLGGTQQDAFPNGFVPPKRDHEDRTTDEQPGDDSSSPDPNINEEWHNPMPRPDEPADDDIVDHPPAPPAEPPATPTEPPQGGGNPTEQPIGNIIYTMGIGFGGTAAGGSGDSGSADTASNSNPNQLESSSGMKQRKLFAKKSDPKPGAKTSSGKSGSFFNFQQVPRTLSSLDPKENWILSILTLCIPGMIHNLEKYRQIQCEYGSCLISSSKSSIPISICDDNKAYAECVFFYGSLFQLIPFANFLSQIQRIIINIMANPLILIDTALDFACHTKLGFKFSACSDQAGTGTVCYSNSAGLWLCIFYDTFKLFTDIYSDIKMFLGNKGYFKIEIGPKRGSCKAFANSYNDLKEEIEQIQNTRV